MVVATTLNYVIALSVLLGYLSFFLEIPPFLQSLPRMNPHLDVLFILQVTLSTSHIPLTWELSKLGACHGRPARKDVTSFAPLR